MGNNSGDQPQPLTIPPFALPASCQEEEDLGDFSDNEEDCKDDEGLPVFSSDADEDRTIGLVSIESLSSSSKSLSHQSAAGSSTSSRDVKFHLGSGSGSGPAVPSVDAPGHRLLGSESDTAPFPSTASQAETVIHRQRRLRQPDDFEDSPPLRPTRYENIIRVSNTPINSSFVEQSSVDLPDSQASDEAISNSMSSRIRYRPEVTAAAATTALH